MKTYEILQNKGDEVHWITPQSTLADVVQTLVDNNCGSLLVMDGTKLTGIITERDILKACAEEDRPLSEIMVYERMTANVMTASPEEDVNTVMGTLTTNRIRHLPIVDQQQLVGVISIGDVVKAQHDRLSMENHFLKQYIIES